MQRILLSGLLIVFSAITVFGQDFFSRPKYIEARLGTMLPWGTGIGFRGGALAGLKIDDMVSINSYLDFCRNNYTASVDISNTSTGVKSTGVKSETTTTLLMWMVNARINIPYTIYNIVLPYVQCGVGYEMMLNNYAATNENTTYMFGGFGLEIETGVHIKLGEKSSLFISAGYNFCGVSRSRAENETLIVGEKIDVSGFSLLAGIGFEL